MNKKNSRMIYTGMICLALIALVLWMFFYMTYDPKEPKRQREISVILYYAGTSGWEALLEGMKQAEDDFSVNINYMILRQDEGAREQLLAVQKEIDSDAEGILLAAADEELLYSPLLEKSFDIPIVLIESGFQENPFRLISGDHYEMGKMLGEEILEDFSGQESLKVALFGADAPRDSVAMRMQGLLDALEGRAEILLEEEAASGTDVQVLVGLHKEALQQLVEQKDMLFEESKIYGIGNTPSIVAALDQGSVEKLVFQNEFNVGYLGVKAILKEIDGIGREETEPIDYYCIGRKELYGTQYERLLFPIVE